MATLATLFIENLQTNQLFFVCVVFTVIVSITLHELSHGIMAIRLGDDTPIHTGHMTANPLVHMGLWSFLALAIVGIAWGSMPINPSRLKGRYAEAKVALAGPMTNLLLAIVSLTALGLWNRFDSTPLEQMPALMSNSRYLLNIFGWFNLVLFAFNLIPIPPLDGSHILANLYRPYAMLLSDPSKHGVFLLAFVFIFIFCDFLFTAAAAVGQWYVLLVATF